MSSGTSADIAACMTLYDFGAKRGDEVIVPALAFAAVGNSVLAAGLTPRFVDIEKDTMNINPYKIDEKINDKTKAVMAVHTMGKPCEMDVICDIAERNNLKVIEDCCEAHGARYKGKIVGHWGDVATFSAYAAHLICCGEGGMSSTNNKEIAEVKSGEVCPKCKKGKISESKSIEVGNIFRFGTVYSEKMNVLFTDKDGKKKPAFLGSYGIGVTRLMGTLVEVFNDEKGIIWPESVAPFQAHLMTIDNSQLTIDKAEEIYQKLQEAGIEVLFDDRKDVSAGEKFADCDLIGIPVRLVVSDKTGKGKVEWKERGKEKVKILTIDEAIKRLQ